MSEKKREHDEIWFGPEIEPGVYAALRRTPDGEVRQVTCSPMRDGSPLRVNSELAHVDEPSDEGWCPLTSIYKVGPAQVATPAYREGYDRIWGKQKVGLA
jgi:hypothetical protein